MIVKHANGLIGFDVADCDPIVRAILIREADARLAAYPQYAGYFDGAEWYVARAIRQVKSRCGVIAEKGDLVLARNHPQEEIDAGIATAGFATIHSPLTGHQHSASTKRDIEAA